MPAVRPARGPAALASDLRRTASATGHRRLLLLAGPREAGHAAVVAALDGRPRLWVGDHAPDGGPITPAHKARTVLGGEWNDVVYDAHAGLDVDALAAVAGTLRGGGLLLLPCPPLERWPDLPDPALARLLSSPHAPADAAGRFVRRLVALLRDDPKAVLYELDRSPPPSPIPVASPVDAPEPDDDGCLGDDQRQAVAAVLTAAVEGVPAVLTADRGRGKSAALGLAAARLLATGVRRIVVTAPRRAAAAALFRHAAARLGLAGSHGDLRTAAGGEIRFVAPDALLRDPRPTDLLLVDEAAAIPAPLLEALLRRDGRIAFATTVHGYEGSGRGFALRFRATLDRLAPGWRDVRLAAPVRWAADDPLEALLDQALLLDAEPSGSPDDAPDDDVRLERVDRDRLAADEPLLRELFGLLVQAHYRTAPSDLRQLLDAPGIGVHVARCGAAVAGVAVTVDEGRIDEATAFAVWAGRRRLRGHLVAQSLAGHGGLRDAPALGFRRVQRIAVVPWLRRHGIARRLLDRVFASARDDGLDLVATSFGMTAELVAFWRACDFVPARVGLRREASSGAHALMMLRPVSATGGAIAELAAVRLARRWPAQRRGPLADLEAELGDVVSAALPASPTNDDADADDWPEAIAFAFARRGPDAAFDALRRATLAVVAEEEATAVVAALRARFVDGRSWSEVASMLGVDGRPAAIERLRQALRPAIRMRIRQQPALRRLVARLESPD